MSEHINRASWGNIIGAFADAAVLFPILALLALVDGYSAGVLFATSGVAYLVAGMIFRVPMSVQPLKALAIGALGLGASSAEIRLGGALLGIVCLLLLFADVDRLARKIPRHLVHGVQLGLGVILIGLGIQVLQGFADSNSWFFLVPGLAVLVIIGSNCFRLPLLGLVASAGMCIALWTEQSAGISPFLGQLDFSSNQDSLRIFLVLSLLLPQIVLTLANSVVATEDVAQRYFGQRANRVRPRRLLYSIGLGNLLSALVGGLPFCHGSGGVTAHVRGGATHWAANLVIGSTLLLFGLLEFLSQSFAVHYPLPLMSVLLMATGAFHLALAQASWADPSKRIYLVVMGVVAIYSRNMLLVLISGIVVEILSFTVERLGIVVKKQTGFGQLEAKEL